MREEASRFVAASGDPRLPGDRPHEADEFASDRRADHRRLLAAPDQRPVTSREAGLGLPGDLAHTWRRGFHPVELLCSDLRRVTVGPGALHQHVPHAPIAGLGDPAAPDRVTGGTLARYEAEISHELTRTLEAADVADLGREGDSDDEVDAAQGLQRPHDRTERPGGHELGDRRLDARHA